MKNTIKITGRYLWLPVKNNVSDIIISLYSGNRKIQELCIGITEEEPDYYAWFDAGEFKNGVIAFEGDYTAAWFDRIRALEERPSNPTKNRPLIHYAPTFGWMNDPNGLIYQNGVYHIYHQHNPYGIKWENIHWAHTETSDFMEYTSTEDVLCPDEEGPVFSGTALKDETDCLGLSKEAIVYFYTSAGGRSHWSETFRFTQKMAISLDQGKTLIKKKEVILPHIAEENRDPKVLYHGKSGFYIMILYIEDDTFYFFRSRDLVHWEKQQEIQIPGMWECPDFFPLTSKEAGKEVWILWSADGYYSLGTFDGVRFVPEMEDGGNHPKRHRLYEIVLDKEGKADRGYVRPYAAQTFMKALKQPLQLSWITVAKEYKNYAGLLSLPGELSLCRTKEGLRLSLLPAEELIKLRKQTHESILGQDSDFMEHNLYTGHDKALELEINIKKTREAAGSPPSYLTLTIFGTVLELDLDQSEFRAGPHRIKLAEGEENKIRLYADVDVFEIFACGGLSYAVVNNEQDSLEGSVTLMHSGVNGMVRLHELEPIRIKDRQRGE